MILKITQSLVVVVLTAIGLMSLASTAFGQSWGDGMYRNGMHQMDWAGQLPMVTISGKVIVDTSFGTPQGMGGRMLCAYCLDTSGTGGKDVQLYFGPYWYEPSGGATPPTAGQAVTIRGGWMSGFIPPMVAVYEINGEKWRDSVGAPPWSGRWVDRNISDTARVYCPTDSLSHVSFTAGFMGMGMMGGGMMWPDSLFCEFEEMDPDSLPYMPIGWAITGFHVDIFNPQGSLMMQGGMQGHGAMRFQSAVGARFRVHPDSLMNRGLSIHDLTLMYLDTDSQWKVAPNQIVDSQTNTIALVTSDTYSYYAMALSSTTSVQNQTPTFPTGFSLSQNYPNPFNPSTTIAFSIPQRALVTLRVYNALGVEVASLVSQHLDRGTYQTRWNAASVPSGMYVYRLQVDGHTIARKMLLLK